MTYVRDRTKSKYEEENIQQFIDATVNYESGINFFSGSDAAAKATEGYFLLVGNKAQLAETDKIKAAIPFYNEAVEFAIADATEGAVFWTTLPDRKRFGVAVISTVASRMNNPIRPDLIIAAVTEAAKAAAGKPLNIFVRSEEELIIASSVSRGASRPFTAKGGLAEKNYMNAADNINVFFPGALKLKAQHLNAVATNTQISMRLIDAPPNLVDTTTFPEIASRFAAKLGFEFTIIQGEELREKGYGGVYGVGKAAEFPPALVTLKYTPKGGITNKEKIALVGKGIIYDTGGLAIKNPVPFMCGMKCDMGGAAIVFSGFLAAVALEASREISCTLCLADNAIGPRSQRNDDLIRLKSGITVEINNTDAEGRLVLADGVWEASQLKPSMIIDMATLTGAQGIATGKMHAGIFTPTEATEQRFVKAGVRSGDLLMPLVYAPEFHNKEFVSKVADCTNTSANKSNAGSSCPGTFIFNNLKEFDGDMVHIDLASPTFQGSQATGYGVGLLVDILTQ